MSVKKKLKMNNLLTFSSACAVNGRCSSAFNLPGSLSSEAPAKSSSSSSSSSGRGLVFQREPRFRICMIDEVPTTITQCKCMAMPWHMHGWHSTVENPHLATLPSVQLLPFLNGPLLWWPTLDAQDYKSRRFKEKVSKMANEWHRAGYHQ